MFEFVSYLIRSTFFRDSKFISSLEEWISKAFMNNVIDNFLSRWHLKKFIKNHKNEITSSDCLKHFYKMRIRECHLAKQRFACIIISIIVRFVFSNSRNATFDRLTSKKLTLCRLNVVIDSNRIYINIEKKLFVLKFLMKYRDKTWYYRVKRDRNNIFFF